MLCWAGSSANVALLTLSLANECQPLSGLPFHMLQAAT